MADLARLERIAASRASAPLSIVLLTLLIGCRFLPIRVVELSPRERAERELDAARTAADSGAIDVALAHYAKATRILPEAIPTWRERLALLRSEANPSAAAAAQRELERIAEASQRAEFVFFSAMASHEEAPRRRKLDRAWRLADEEQRFAAWNEQDFFGLRSPSDWRAHAAFLSQPEHDADELAFTKLWLQRECGRALDAQPVPTATTNPWAALSPAERCALEAWLAIDRGQTDAALMPIDALRSALSSSLGEHEDPELWWQLVRLELRMLGRGGGRVTALAPIERLFASSRRQAVARLRALVAALDGNGEFSGSRLQALWTAARTPSLRWHVARVAFERSSEAPGVRDLLITTARDWCMRARDGEAIAAQFAAVGDVAGVRVALRAADRVRTANDLASERDRRLREFVESPRMTSRLLKGAWRHLVAPHYELPRAWFASLDTDLARDYVAILTSSAELRLRIVGLQLLRRQPWCDAASLPEAPGLDSDERERGAWLLAAAKVGGETARHAIEEARSDPSTYVRELAKSLPDDRR